MRVVDMSETFTEHLDEVVGRRKYATLEGVLYLSYRCRRADAEYAVEKLTAEVNELHKRFGVEGFLAMAGSVDLHETLVGGLPACIVFSYPVVGPENFEAASEYVTGKGFGKTEVGIMKTLEPRWPHFVVRGRGDAGGPLTGSRTIVEMNGERLAKVTDFEFRVKAKGIAEVKLTMLASVDLEATVGDFSARQPLLTKAKDGTWRETDVKCDPDPAAAKCCTEETGCGLCTGPCGTPET